MPQTITILNPQRAAVRGGMQVWETDDYAKHEDVKNGVKTKQLLSVPCKLPAKDSDGNGSGGRVLGCIHCINKIQPAGSENPFSNHDERCASALAAYVESPSLNICHAISDRAFGSESAVGADKSEASMRTDRSLNPSSLASFQLAP